MNKKIKKIKKSVNLQTIELAEYNQSVIAECKKINISVMYQYYSLLNGLISEITPQNIGVGRGDNK